MSTKKTITMDGKWEDDSILCPTWYLYGCWSFVVLGFILGAYCALVVGL